MVGGCWTYHHPFSADQLFGQQCILCQHSRRHPTNHGSYTKKGREEHTLNRSPNCIIELKQLSKCPSIIQNMHHFIDACRLGPTYFVSAKKGGNKRLKSTS